MTENRRRLRWILVSSLLLIPALLLRQFLPELPESSPWRDAYLLARRALLQLGAFGLLLGFASYGTALLRRAIGWPSVLSRGNLLGLCAAAALVAITGEVALRIWFWNGASFASHYGPIVRLFERDLVLNQYDGPSRGPEIAGFQTRGWTLLIQGDSITWGQGVREEEDLYTTLLLADLRSTGVPVEMAVLAAPGRELDGHVEQLRRYGPNLRPDLVIDQWYYNDVRVDRTVTALGLGRRAPWRRFILHRVLATHSYFWFFMDYRVNAILFGRERGRISTNHFLSHYAAGALGWSAFETQFSNWAKEARALTPRTLIVLYPSIGGSRAWDEPLRRQVRDLASEHGCEVLDLQDALAAAAANPRDLWASPYDGHPGAKAHAVIAAEISKLIDERWPELRAVPIQKASDERASN